MTSEPCLSPSAAVSAIEPGRWGVAVSGGADSVALLRLAAERTDLSLHIIHLNHQTRGADSDGDAAFVADLAARLRLPATIEERDRLEASLPATDREALPANPSARYRALRLALHRRVTAAEGLSGVLLAHHADDQAESVLLRLLRGGGYPALSAMSARAAVADVVLRRPLLQVRRSALRDHLTAIGQPWREDASNATGDYARNRVRMVLAGREHLIPVLLGVADACRDLDDWVQSRLPELPATLPTRLLADLPQVLARTAAATWMMARGVPADAVAPGHVSLLLEMCRDAAATPKLDLPGNIRIARRRGVLIAEK